jgi:hypothetical protein
MSKRQLNLSLNTGTEDRSIETSATESSNKIEAIIRTVAVKHGIALGRNDPILILHTLNALLIDDFSKKQDDLIHQFRVNLEEVANHSSTSMEAKVAEINSNMENNHTKFSHDMLEKQIDQMVLILSDRCADLTTTQQKRTLKYLKTFTVQLRSLKLMIYVNFAVLILALISAIVLIGSLSFT